MCVRALVLHFHHTCRFFVWPEVCALLVRLMFVFRLNLLTTCTYFAASLCQCVQKCMASIGGVHLCVGVENQVEVPETH